MDSRSPVPTAPEPASDYLCDLNRIQFPSIKKDAMRVSLKTGEDLSAIIWVESKTTKAQWQLEVKDVAQHGPGGIPSSVVFNLLKAARILFLFHVMGNT